MAFPGNESPKSQKNDRYNNDYFPEWKALALSLRRRIPTDRGRDSHRD